MTLSNEISSIQNLCWNYYDKQHPGAIVEEGEGISISKPKKNFLTVDFHELHLLSLISLVSSTLEKEIGTRYPRGKYLNIPMMMKFVFRNGNHVGKEYQLLPQCHLRPTYISLAANYLRKFLGHNQMWQNIQENYEKKTRNKITLGERQIRNDYWKAQEQLQLTKLLKKKVQVALEGKAQLQQEKEERILRKKEKFLKMFSGIMNIT